MIFWKWELLVAKSRVSVTVLKTWKDHAILDSMENLRFDEEGYCFTRFSFLQVIL